MGPGTWRITGTCSIAGFIDHFFEISVELKANRWLPAEAAHEMGWVRYVARFCLNSNKNARVGVGIIRWHHCLRAITSFTISR